MAVDILAAGTMAGRGVDMVLPYIHWVCPNSSSATWCLWPSTITLILRGDKPGGRERSSCIMRHSRDTQLLLSSLLADPTNHQLSRVQDWNLNRALWWHECDRNNVIGRPHGGRGAKLQPPVATPVELPLLWGT